MSRQAKQARKKALKLQFTANRKRGNPGPAQTTPKHGKKRAWWQVGTKRLTRQSIED